MTLALSLLLACGESADPKPSSAPSTAAPTAPTSAPAAAPKKQAGSHCNEGQKVWYQCTVSQGRVVSLCGDEAPGFLQYHFGPLGAPGLSVPSAPDGLGRFGFASQTWAQGQLEAVRFDNEGTTYLLVDKAGAGGENGEANNFQGIVVRQGGKELARYACTDILQTEISSLDGRLQALGYEG